MSAFDRVELIISKPERIKPIQKLSELTVTMLFWMIIFYLWQPLISFIAWSFGYKWYYQHMITLGGIEHVINALLDYLSVILMLGGALILWAITNKWRFKNKNKRSSINPVDSKAIAQHFNVESEDLAKMLIAPNVSLNISQDFTILSKINPIISSPFKIETK